VTAPLEHEIIAHAGHVASGTWVKGCPSCELIVDDLKRAAPLSPGALQALAAVQASANAVPNPYRQIADKIDAEKLYVHPLGGAKDNRLKPRVELLPVDALLEAAKVFAYGAAKYEDWNWAKGISWAQTYASVLRHLFAWQRGEDIDPESGLPHAAHALSQMMILVHFIETKTGEDDRP
jgi:hypothetical protein